MWPLLPALPAALIGLGAAAGLVPATRAQDELRRVLALCATIAASIASGLVVRQAVAGPNTGFALPLWPASIFGASPTVAVDSAGAWCLLLLASASVLAVVRSFASRAPLGTLGRSLLVAAAAALLLASLRSPIGLALSWAGLDLALFMAGGGSRHGLLAGQAGLAFALVGLSSLPHTGFAEASSAAGLSARSWLIAASAIRMGVFPIWWAVPSARRQHQWASGLIRLAPTLVGACLAIEAARLGPLPATLTGGMGMALLAVAGSGILAGLSRRHGRALDWSLAHSAGLVLLAGSIGGVAADAISLLIVTEIAVSRAGAYLLVRHPVDSVHRYSSLILTAGLAGVPPLLGFAARWPLYRELLARGQVAALVVTSLATAFALAGTLRTRPSGVPDIPPSGRRGVTAGRAVALLVAGLELALGIGLGLLATSPIPGHLALPDPVLELTTGLASAAGRPGAALALGLLLLPLVLGGMLARVLARTVDRGRLSALDLTPAVDSVAGALLDLGAVLQKASGLVEGRRALAWTLLAAVTVALVPLRPPEGGAAPSAITLIALAAAGAIAAAVALSQRPWVPLAAAVCAYLLSAVVLAATGTPWVIAAIKVIAGLFVVGVLAMSAMQGSTEVVRAAAASRRLAGLRPSAATGWGTVPLLAIAAVVVLSAGVHSVVAADRLPDVALQVALTLAAGGAIAVALARDPLRLATGTLLAVIGFELAYARLDPGLVVTGALAGFQLLFALVASYFVGEAMSLEGDEPADAESLLGVPP